MFNRRHFIQTSLAALATTPLLSLGADAPEQKPVAPDAPHPGQPLVTAPTPDSVTIVWAVDAPCTGWVEFGDTEALGEFARGAVDGLRPFDSHVISIPVRGLCAGQKVFYRTVTVPVNFPNQYKMSRGTAMASPVYSLTLPGAGAAAKIAVWNDTHQHADGLAAVRKFTAEFAPSLLVWNGDVVGDQFMREADLSDSFLRPGSGVELSSDCPVLFARGNHDVRGAVARDLPGYMPRPLGNGYQNLLRIGPVGVIVLDTGEDKEGPQFYADLGEWANYRETQRAWLESAVKNPLFAEAPHKILFCHIPLRWREPDDKGSWCEDGDKRWSPLLAQAGVSAVLSGHTHRFWHDAPNAERPFHQIIGGGPITDPAKKPDAWTPPTVTTLVADEKALSIEVVEATSRKNLLSLKLKV